ncbi:M55 family metallopeptidase [PVC group bacterium]|nr:M55 family metallopeptidase [PVC group bacterium]
MNVYIVADIEGIAGMVFYEHRHRDMTPLSYELLHRNRVLLTEEVNAAARGAFDAGAESVVVHDHHGQGYTILPELMDKRLELIHGRPEQYLTLGVHHPDLNESIDALILIGMHAKAGTTDGCTPHSLICVTDGEGKRHELSEATMSMAYAGTYGVPCVFIAGDRATVDDALGLVPSLERVETKSHYASQVARTKSPTLVRELIEAGVRRGVERRSEIQPFVIPGPCTIQIADRNPAARWPESPNTRKDFATALCDTLQNVPWYKPVEAIDDGWRYPDRITPSEMPNDRWNTPADEADRSDPN